MKTRMTKEYTNAEPMNERSMGGREFEAKVQGADPQTVLAAIPIGAFETPQDRGVRMLQGSLGMDHRGIHELGTPCSESWRGPFAAW
jgi:hypothetical protein